MRAFHHLPPTDERWLSMSLPEIFHEFRQIVAYRYEESNPSKLFADKEGDTIIDDEFDAFLESIGAKS